MKTKRNLKGLLFFLAGGLLSLAVLAAACYISNRSLPTGPTVTDRLTELDKTRLEETLHLKAALGETVWPGWGEMDIPILLWHQDNNFLIGIDDLPEEWETVKNDQFQGDAYFANSRFDSENFAVYIGNRWVASMATKGETDAFMQGVFRDVIPDPLEPFFPFRLLILNSEIQISGVLHETFHVYQVSQSPDQFTRADNAHQGNDRYWEIDLDMGTAWEEEMNLLIDAATSQDDQEVRVAAIQYLAVRDARRDTHGLTEKLVDYEIQTEWLEGLAKYVELSIWEAAFNSPHYRPLLGTDEDPDFKDYQTFKRRWNQEISQARRQATIEGDVRFYYSGMLQARILDKLMPDWKSKVMEGDAYLEDLIRQAITP
jgi:hypothetical protein